MTDEGIEKKRRGAKENEREKERKKGKNTEGGKERVLLLVSENRMNYYYCE